MTSRRDFIRTGSAATAALVGAPTIVLRSRASADVVVRNGNVFDGLGGPSRQLDVVTRGGRVVALSKNASERATVEIDAKGLAVAPGFIDIHSHGDGTLWQDPRAESLVRQGVTTIVVGQDGSYRPDLWAALAKIQPSVNVASMVGLGTIRGAVVGGDDRPAKPDELALMSAMVEQALADGASGVSTGLEYTPGAFAPREELIALSKPLAARGLPYATHMRNEDDRLIEAIDEAIAVARGAGCPLEISHLKAEGPRNWSKPDTAFQHIADARAAGCDAAFDCYPYIAFQTGLTNLFPVWSRYGSDAAFLVRLRDPGTADRIERETRAKVDLIGGWDDVMIANVSNPADRPVEGARLGTYAASQHMEPYAFAVALLQRNRANVGMVGFAMSEQDVERILAHPLSAVCSDGGAFAIDGPARRGHPHPRGLGTFPRVLGRYVRERRTLTLEQAINKMTAKPAARLHLRDRGRLAPNMAADLVVFDPSTIADKATYVDPFQYPVGIHAVIVNGSVSLRENERSTTGAGRALRVV